MLSKWYDEESGDTKSTKDEEVAILAVFTLR
jgi:hypothetical protein